MVLEFYLIDHHFYPDQPFLIKEGSIIDLDIINTNMTHSGIHFNGYLVDENYFANCGGGGSSSSTSSLDSTTIANMIAAGGGSGCDFKFPDGKDGEFITHNFSANYVVPAGKNLHITNLKCTNSNTKLEIDGLAVYSDIQIVTTGNGEKINMPIIAKEGQSLTHGTSSSIINGIPTDATVTPITHELSTNYIVPSGKKLFITNLRCTHQTNELKIDGEGIYSGYSNVSTGPGTIIKMPIMASSGQEISHSTQTSVFNGYLVDENYFANCGGGSSSSTSTLDSTTIANMIASQSKKSFDYPLGIDGGIDT